MWIDALCINQSDDDEKSWQVALMGRIFKWATLVVAWLGPEEDHSDVAMMALWEARFHTEFDWQTQTLRPSDRTSELHWGDRRYFFGWDGDTQDYLCSLFQRPYFQRLWIIPEIVLARDTVFCCGFEEMAGEDFWVAVACVHSKPTKKVLFTPERLKELMSATAAVYDVCPKFKRPGGFQYARLWTYIRGSQCKDQRDRIYGVNSLLHPEDQRLNVRPDYTKRVEDVYVEVASRIIIKRRILSLFEICDLSSRTLKLPTWVPDWSSCPRFKHVVFSTWSASGYISSQAIIKENGKALTTPGVRAAQVALSTDFQFNEDVCYPNEMLHIVRSLKPSPEELASEYKSGGSSLEAYCSTICTGRCAEGYSRPQPGLADRSMEQLCADLDTIWSTEGEFADLGDMEYYRILQGFHHYLVGRCFIKTNEGYIGLAPLGTQTGDIICIVLGCKFPVVLRPSLEAENQTWELVGHCYIHGLMNGEMIYRGRLNKPYKSFWVERSKRYEDDIDGDPFAMYDPDKPEVYIRDPDKLLEEAGIKVEKFNRYPYLLEVLPQTLRDAGVPLEDFTLV